ncbi:phosphoenolpyruvate--protein phosphotransferase [Effusibacillus dendaii]|uniref:Phosphoenolpyruvate-protein phosphotransferase n=1 Tax=Effusibacillus dendaii TaxID=2743772 RepID=A0A7I8D4L0_9BACL|nr:phosphoenolpyruvate--protein phosphotransferase [Effusibacillus dendaii]BCJ85053.1 phosphoenolpyruvate-protein phosphotransferase [Effusibacillus dendaii]
MEELVTVTVYRPLPGAVVPIEQVPDKVFADKLLGDGVAVQAEDGCVHSPVEGEVVLLFPTLHALAIRTEHDLEIMIHIGLDTVHLQGEGFTALVKVGDRVQIGQPLIRFDLQQVAKTHSLLTPVLVANMERVERIEQGTGDVLFHVFVKRERTLQGLPISEGIAMGTAFVIRPSHNVKRYLVDDPAAETERFRNAVLMAKEEMGKLIQTATTRLSAQEIEILSAQELLLEDPLLMDEVLQGICERGTNAEWLVWDVMQHWIQEFFAMEDPYMRGRAIDLIDVRDRLLKALEGRAHTIEDLIDAPGVLVLDEIPPSIAGEPYISYILGIVTVRGNETSHGAIIARSLGIPVVSGLGDEVLQIEHGDFLIVDGVSGQVVQHPTQDSLDHFQQKLIDQMAAEKELLIWKDRKALTKDQFPVSMGANIGGLEDTKRVRKYGADEIGLFRTEILFMSYQHWPTEDEQFTAYQRILQEMEGRPVIFRVLDIGGDKPLPYFSIEEQNPFLGYRGIRVLFDQKEKFRSQLRALYRASRFGPVKIMFPMIHSIEEWQEIQSICEEVRKETGVESVPLGLMVETPAAALLIDFFVEYVDFVSIGTNDLTQYTLAVDRQNDRVKELYDPFHPAVLRLIQYVVRAAKAKDRWVGVCGELAGDERMLPFWIGLGVNELSVNPSRILWLKKRISELTAEQAKLLVDRLQTARTRDEVIRVLQEHEHLLS